MAKEVYYGNAQQQRIQEHTDKIREVERNLTRTLGAWWLHAGDASRCPNAEYTVFTRIQDMRKVLDAIEADIATEDEQREEDEHIYNSIIEDGLRR